MLPHNQKRIPRLLLTLLATGVFWFASCENDLENIKRIANMSSGLPVDTTRGVDVIYSDSAVVKGRMVTPLLIKYSGDKPYDTMPEGIKVIFFDKNGKEEGNIVADSAVQLENESITKFYKNVVATSVDGKVFRGEELIWDQPKKQVYSTKRVDMTTPDGKNFTGLDFTSDDKFEHPEWKSGTGEFDVPENQMQ